MGVAVTLDPQGEAGHVLVGLRFLPGRLHLVVEHQADTCRNGRRDPNDKEEALGAQVVVHINGLAMLGIVVQRVICHLDVGAGRPGPVAVRELGDDVVLHLLNAVIGKGRDTAAIGDGDILAGADCQQEEDAALFRAAAQTVGKIVIFGVLALVGLVAGGGIYTFMKQKQKKQAEKEALDPDANYTEDKGDFEIPVEDEPEETGEEDNAEE